MHLERRPLAGSRTTWRPGTALVVDGTVLRLQLPAAPDAVLTPAPRGA
ncbi:hypothetical protein GTQ99_18185, partial [Kineococcus sp. T13]|nr:hypothetical protein [Kineococcus vitellinus]